MVTCESLQLQRAEMNLSAATFTSLLNEQDVIQFVSEDKENELF